MMESFYSWDEIVVRLGLALLLGATLGLEREYKYKVAGVRTFMLVSLGAAAFTLIGLDMAQMELASNGNVKIDYSRVVQGIVAGIGFLGAGALIRADDKRVTGFATSAGIWVSGAIGIACGLGLFVQAVIICVGTLLVFLIGSARALLRDDLEEDRGDVSGKTVEGTDTEKDD